MSTREATDTITGYFYQFDKTILELLQQEKPEATVIIEGIEDLDIILDDDTNAIQCKYYAKTEYKNSVIKKPIQLMLKHYSDNKSKNIKYHLYGHFKSGQDKFPDLSIENLKNLFLTETTKESNSSDKKITRYHHEELGLTDIELDIFLKKLIIDINAPSFDEQYNEIIKLIKENLKVTDLEADAYHYNAALKLIKQLSKEQNREDRTIKKSEFLKKISAKDEIFDIWFIKRKGREKYLKFIKKKYLTSGLNIDSYERFFLLECDNKTNLVDIKHTMFNILNKWSNLSKRQKDRFCPSIYIHGLSIDKIKELKNIIYSENTIFIDPYPFWGSKISIKHFYTSPTIENEIKFKFVNTLNELNELIDSCKKTVEIYQFYLNDIYYSNKKHMHRKIKIEDITYIMELTK